MSIATEPMTTVTSVTSVTSVTIQWMNGDLDLIELTAEQYAAPLIETLSYLQTVLKSRVPMEPLQTIRLMDPTEEDDLANCISHRYLCSHRGPPPSRLLAMIVPVEVQITRQYMCHVRPRDRSVPRFGVIRYDVRFIPWHLDAPSLTFFVDVDEPHKVYDSRQIEIEWMSSYRGAPESNAFFLRTGSTPFLSVDQWAAHHPFLRDNRLVDELVRKWNAQEVINFDGQNDRAAEE